MGLTIVPEEGLSGTLAVWRGGLRAASAGCADTAVVTAVALQCAITLHASLNGETRADMCNVQNTCLEPLND